MKTFLTRFFVVLGVIFFCILLFGMYMWYADPFEIKPLVRLFIHSKEVEKSSTDVGSADTEFRNGESYQGSAEYATTTHDKHPALSPEQEQALEKVGINPATLPSSLSDTQLACATQILGSPRVNEIKNGATPTVVEIMSVRTCLE